MTKRRRHTPEQVIRKSREGERRLGQGSDLAAVCKHLEVSEQIWHRWPSGHQGRTPATIHGERVVRNSGMQHFRRRAPGSSAIALKKFARSGSSKRSVVGEVVPCRRTNTLEFVNAPEAPRGGLNAGPHECERLSPTGLSVTSTH